MVDRFLILFPKTKDDESRGHCQRTAAESLLSKERRFIPSWRYYYDEEEEEDFGWEEQLTFKMPSCTLCAAEKEDNRRRNRLKHASVHAIHLNRSCTQRHLKERSSYVPGHSSLYLLEGGSSNASLNSKQKFQLFFHGSRYKTPPFLKKKQQPHFNICA